jgi:hypothetical protein
MPSCRFSRAQGVPTAQRDRRRGTRPAFSAWRDRLEACARSIPSRRSWIIVNRTGPAKRGCRSRRKAPGFAAFLVECGIDFSVSPDSFVAVKRHVARAEAQMMASSEPAAPLT